MIKILLIGWTLSTVLVAILVFRYFINKFKQDKINKRAEK
jgi:hypothetical protein